MKPERARYLEFVARWALALVFLASSLPKLAQPAEFAVAIYRYQLLPHAAINAMAVFLPWLELVCAAALLGWRAGRRGALWLVLGMLAMFTAAIGINLYRGIDIACGCFSVSAARGHLGGLGIARNLALMGAVAVSLRFSAPLRPGPDR